MISGLDGPFPSWVIDWACPRHVALRSTQFE
jgi:hypothetical protein